MTSVLDALSSVGKDLIVARAALIEVGIEIHSDRPDNCDCGPECASYHDALRAVTRAAEAVGIPVGEFALYAADYVGQRSDER